MEKSMDEYEDGKADRCRVYRMLWMCKWPASCLHPYRKSPSTPTRRRTATRCTCVRCTVPCPAFSLSSSTRSPADAGAFHKNQQLYCARKFYKNYIHLISLLLRFKIAGRGLAMKFRANGHEFLVCDSYVSWKRLWKSKMVKKYSFFLVHWTMLRKLTVMYFTAFKQLRLMRLKL